MSEEEISLLRQIALKALEMFDSDDLWIDGNNAGYRAEELQKLVTQWKSDYQKPRIPLEKVIGEENARKLAKGLMEDDNGPQ